MNPKKKPKSLPNYDFPEEVIFNSCPKSFHITSRRVFQSMPEKFQIMSRRWFLCLFVFGWPQKNYARKIFQIMSLEGFFK
jgi:hypothetical protein